MKATHIFFTKIVVPTYVVSHHPTNMPHKDEGETKRYASLGKDYELQQQKEHIIYIITL